MTSQCGIMLFTKTSLEQTSYFMLLDNFGPESSMNFLSIAIEMPLKTVFG
jgi:hypothetical protein